MKFFAHLFICLLLIGVALPLNAVPAASTNSVEPIILSAEAIKTLIGRSPEQIDFFAYRGNRLQPIPWQWDPVNRDGWVQMEKPSGKPLIGPKDIFLWMVKDLGDVAPSSTLKAACADCEWLQAAFGNEQNKGKPQILYVLLAKKPQKPTEIDYVRYDSTADLAITPSYYVGYRDLIVANQFGHVNPDGTLGRNLIDQVLVSFSARVLFGLFPLHVSEKDLQSKQLGYRDGKIRVIQRLSTRFKLGLGLKGPSNIAESYFYPNFYHTKIDIHFPVGGKALIRHATFRFNIDLTTPAQDVIIHLPPDHIFTLGKDQPEGVTSLLTQAPGWANFAELGTTNEFLVHIAIPTKEKEIIQINRLEFNHAPTDKKIGTVTLDVNITTKAGDHSFSLYLFTPPNQIAKSADQVFARIREYAQMLESPTHLLAVDEPS